MIFVILIPTAGKLLGGDSLQENDLGSGCQVRGQFCICFPRTVQCLPWALSSQAECTWTGHSPMTCVPIFLSSSLCLPKA